MPSPLSENVRRLGDILRRGAEEQVEEAGASLRMAGELYDGLLSDLLITEFDPGRARETASAFFGSPRVRFAAIDGSQDQRLVGGLAIFWGGAYASTGIVEFRGDGPPKIEYMTGFVERGMGVSSCVPIYVSRVHEIDPAASEAIGRGGLAPLGPMTEQALVDNSSIAGWVMTLSELYLAYKMVVEGGAKIILLDRSLSGTWINLAYDTSRRSRWRIDGAIHGLEIDGTAIDANEMGFGRYHVVNKALGTPPPRGDYLRYALLYHLRDSGARTLDGICSELGIEGEGRRRRALKYLEKCVGEGYLSSSGGLYALNGRYLPSWDRLRRLVLSLCDRLFKGSAQNPMRIEAGGGRKWVTAQDLAFLCLYCFNMLLEECWARGVLLVGITKDTTARDFKAHLVPVCAREGIWDADPGAAQGFPGTDRTLLQAVSALNWDRVAVPWALIEYDSAFQTIVPDPERRRGFVCGARKNRIIMERLFLKNYVQLDESERDRRLRSNVLLIDRLAHPDYDLRSSMEFKHEFGGAVEPVRPILYKDRGVRNDLQNLMIVVLKAMSPKGIPEAFGHNKPLFIADKIAKAQREEAVGLMDAVGHWVANNPRLRGLSFYMHTFRERRAEVERARREG
jgi:hypothetical protein